MAFGSAKKNGRMEEYIMVAPKRRGEWRNGLWLRQKEEENGGMGYGSAKKNGRIEEWVIVAPKRTGEGRNGIW